MGKENTALRGIDYFVTEKDSIYYCLNNGRTQRFKKVEDSYYAQQNAIVFLPDYKFLQNNIKEKTFPNLGENDSQFKQTIQEYIHGKGTKTYIVDQNGEKLDNNFDIYSNFGGIYLAFLRNDLVDFLMPVAKDPRIGFSPFDTSKYESKNGQKMRDVHLGHKVVSIIGERP